MNHTEWMARAEQEYDRLLVLLRSLGADDWARQTDCEGWQVRDIVAHLVGAAAGNARLREAVRQARLGMRLRRGRPLVDGMNDVQVGERAGRSPDDLVTDLAATAPDGVAGRRRLPAAVRAVRVPFGPPLGVASVGYLMDTIYTRDVWMHRIDISRATGRELDLTADHDGVLVADVVADWERRHRAAYELVLTGPAGGRFRRGSAGERHVLDAVEFARIVSGRRPGDGLLAVGVPF